MCHTGVALSLTRGTSNRILTQLVDCPGDTFEAGNSRHVLTTIATKKDFIHINLDLAVSATSMAGLNV
jgi:hypothetical protein